mmetsp:Transcript_39996/g.62414  ORF Transcript_39996/g.62414 Transcript_39996/m.62414 type:complete len:236 (+) Transcript_39996:82-789(+)
MQALRALGSAMRGLSLRSNAPLPAMSQNPMGQVFGMKAAAPMVGALGWQQVREMRHGRRRGTFNRKPKHAWALLRNQVTSLIEHERIRTTFARAKALKRLADQMVSLGKEGTLNSRRRAGAVIQTDETIHKLFTVLADRYRERTGGYTRVLRCIKNRIGDQAPMAYIEYVDRPGELRSTKPPVERLPYAKRLQQALDEGDEDAAEYYRGMQEAELASKEARRQRIEGRKIQLAKQ